MNTISSENKFSLKNKLIDIFENNIDILLNNDNKIIKEIREKAIDEFIKQGFPDSKQEVWRTTNLSKVISQDYDFFVDYPHNTIDIDKLFTCDVPDIDTYLVTLYNGWFTYKNKQISILNDGTVIGSFEQAMKLYPNMFEKHFGQYAAISDNGLIAINTAFSQDGVFIYVPDGVKVKIPIQIVSIVDCNDNIFIQPRNLIILGKDSKLTLIHCDHSLHHKNSFINSVSEIYIDKNAELEYYKVQNKDIQSNLITSLYFRQEENSKLSSNTITLNGGLVRNNIKVEVKGSNCESDLKGLYLADAHQHIDSNVFVDHISPDSVSTQMYRGIIDDNATGIYNGHIRVCRGAQKTKAYQNNKNILLSEKAVALSNPHLEIYADDVQCSHGATVGQLDSEAMFYMRSRGISEEKARIMLMYAFAVEITGKISIPALRERIDLLIEKRLSGELSICDQCVLYCKDRNPLVFDIDINNKV